MLRWVSVSLFASNIGFEAPLDGGYVSQSIAFGKSAFAFAVPNRSFMATPPSNLWHVAQLKPKQTELQPIKGLGGSGFLEVVADRANRIHIATRGPAGRAGQYAYYDGKWHVAKADLPPVAGLAVDPQGQPWILTQNGRLLSPDGTHHDTGLQQVTQARWAFGEQGVDILARAVVGDTKALSLLLVRQTSDGISLDPISTDPVFTHDKATKGVVAQSDYPRGLVRTTDGLVAVYERSQTMGRVECKKVACRDWGPCEGRDCRLGRMQPQCLVPGVPFNSVCEVIPTSMRQRASLRARRMGSTGVAEVVLVRNRWADRIVVDFGDQHIAVAIDANRANGANSTVYLLRLSR